MIINSVNPVRGPIGRSPVSPTSTFASSVFVAFDQPSEKLWSFELFMPNCQTCGSNRAPWYFFPVLFHFKANQKSVSQRNTWELFVLSNLPNNGVCQRSPPTAVWRIRVFVLMASLLARVSQIDFCCTIWKIQQHSLRKLVYSTPSFQPVERFSRELTYLD